MNANRGFHSYIERWNLVPDGAPIVTHSSRLLPVRRDGEAAMLKVAVAPEEKYGSRLMIWWNGIGAARVMEHDDDALLLERAEGSRSLAAMASAGADDEASRILCKAIAGLHAPRSAAPPKLVPLTEWFRALEPMAAREVGILLRCSAIARELLNDSREIVPLHGDVHHGNVLDFEERGWLAIDPKGLHGERGFDYANLFCNPSLDVAMAPGRLARQVNVVVEAAKLERRRLLQWIAAWGGLSSAWLLEEGGNLEREPAFRVAEIALAELDKE